MQDALKSKKHDFERSFKKEQRKRKAEDMNKMQKIKTFIRHKTDESVEAAPKQMIDDRPNVRNGSLVGYGTSDSE